MTGAPFIGMYPFQWVALVTAALALLLAGEALVGHYRKGFGLRAQYAPLASGGLLVVSAVAAAAAPGAAWANAALSAAGWLALLTGAAGFAFHHYYGIARKPGGYGWLLHHLMYGAPQLAPLAFAHVGLLALVTARGLWGAGLRRAMLDYNHYSGLGIVGEVLPQEANVVKLHDTERDGYDLPVAHVVFSHHENDKRIVAHAKGKMTEILGAAGGEDVWSADRTAHLLGTCRMGSDPANSVVNADCRAHDVPNLFVCDGSVFPTSTAVNPSLTIQAIAARTAGRIREIVRGASAEAPGHEPRSKTTCAALDGNRVGEDS